MGGMFINNQSTGGHLYELKKDVTIEQAKKAGQKDGLDQVYFEAKGKNYVVEGDNLDLKTISGLKKDENALAIVKIGDDLLTVEVKKDNVDNEITSFGEGASNKLAKIGLKGTIITGVGSVVVGGGSILAGLSNGSWDTLCAGLKLATLIGVATGASALIGGVVAETKGIHPEKLQDSKGTQVN